MRATGANPHMARAQGIRPRSTVYVGMALSNALVALAGALFAQTNGFADVTTGVGTIVVGLAAVIVGETLFRCGGRPRGRADRLRASGRSSIGSRSSWRLSAESPSACSRPTSTS